MILSKMHGEVTFFTQLAVLALVLAAIQAIKRPYGVPGLAFDPTRLAAFGEVHAPGSWGRLMNGGAWLTVDGVVVTAMPDALVRGAPPRWRFARDFSLEYARMLAARENIVGAIGHAAKAVVEEAHARLCTRGQWVLNEKRLLSAAGLEPAQRLFAAPPHSASSLAAWLDAVAACLAIGVGVQGRPGPDGEGAQRHLSAILPRGHRMADGPVPHPA
jgi:hypothetical protein